MFSESQTDARRIWNPVTGLIQNLHFDPPQWACLLGLPDHGWGGWNWFMGHFGIHIQDQVLQAYCWRHGQIWLFLGPLANGTGGRTKAKHRGNRAVSRSVTIATVVESATWEQTCLLKMALISLGLHWVFLFAFCEIILRVLFAIF